MGRKLGYLILLSVELSLLLCIGILIWLYYFSYPDLIQTVLDQIHRPDLKQVLEMVYFPQSKWTILHNLLLPFAALLAALAGLLLVKRRKVLQSIIKRTENLFSSLQTMWRMYAYSTWFIKGSVVLVLLLLLLRSLWMMNQYPVQYDEAWNYNYFLHSHPWLTVFAYNNYPLHNILTSVLLFFTPHNPLTLRLPVVFFGLCTSLSVFIIVLKIWKKPTLAILAMLLFTSLPVSIYYMLYARGVMVSIFFGLWALYFMYRSLENEIFHPYKMALFQILACYAMLSYVYCIVWSYAFCLLYFSVKKNNQAVYILMKSAFACFIGLFLLFLPMIMGTGIFQGLQAAGAKTDLTALHQWPYHNYSQFFTGSSFGFYILLALSLVLLLRKQTPHKVFLLSLGVLLLLPLSLTFLPLSFPPERAMAFLLFPVGFLGIYALSVLPKSGAWLTTFAAIIALHVYTLRSNYLNWSKQLDQQVFTLASTLEEKKIRTLYTEERDFAYFIPGITFYHLLHQKHILVQSADTQSTRYATPEHKFQADAFVCSTDSVYPNSVLFRTEDFVVYEKK